jgi:Recombination endonuclease VII
MRIKGSRKKFCKRGHPRTPENLAGTSCKICHKNTVKYSHIKRTYGVTRAEYDDKVKSQSSRCAICQRLSDSLAQDHCHTTNVSRDLLCLNCNLALGRIFDDILIAQAIVDYLKRWKACQV